MLFNSFSFLAFLVCVILIHALPLPWSVRKFNLLVASYLFYAAWSPWFTLLLMFATATNFLSAALIHQLERSERQRRLVLWGDVSLNIGLLCAFKYGNELVAAWNWTTSHLGATEAASRMAILLPIGLSFFTLQSLSYTIDVYRRNIPPTRSLLDFALFVAFFPVLLAGPLLRAGAFLPQCASPRRASLADLGYGAALITLGVFMKTTLADGFLAPIVHQIFAPNVQPSTLSAWMGTMAFAGQDYCDFGGYACCAVGVGACLGFSLPDNFRAPFASVGFRDLWQRWHITLVAWMRDYVFLSLGGVFKGYRRAAINVLIVFLIIGLWHGAKLTYVVFGVLHGSFLIVETILQRSPLRRKPLWNTIPGIALLWLATMFLCCLAFAFYRAQDLDQAWTVLTAMLGSVPTAHAFHLNDSDTILVALTLEAIVIVHWLRRHLSLRETIARAPSWLVAVCLAGMLFLIAITSGESQAFLYFQF